MWDVWYEFDRFGLPKTPTDKPCATYRFTARESRDGDHSHSILSTPSKKEGKTVAQVESYRRRVGVVLFVYLLLRKRESGIGAAKVGVN